MEPAQQEQYLALLDSPPVTLDLAGLTVLVQAHLCHIPFENVSKLYFLKMQNRKRIPSLDEFLEAAESHHLGGTCYSLNYRFCDLLCTLGFDAWICGADMNRPNVHMVINVRLQGRRYLVDVGYAAPFRSPIPCFLDKVQTIECGMDRYLFHPLDEHQRTRLDLYRDGELKHGYRVNPQARSFSGFEPAVLDSYRTDATFMNSLLLTRYCRGGSVRIYNRELRRMSDEGSAIMTIATNEEIATSVLKHFQIPFDITIKALSGIELQGDAWS